MLTWLARGAALGCLAGCCVSRGALAVALLAAGALVFAAVGELTRTPWCYCGHIKAVHDHYTTGTYCSSCACEAFAGMITWRKR